MRRRLYVWLVVLNVLGATSVKADTVNVLRFWPNDGIWIQYITDVSANFVQVFVYCWPDTSGCTTHNQAYDVPPTEQWVQDTVSHNHYSHKPEIFVIFNHTWGEEQFLGRARAAWDCLDARSALNQEFVDQYSGGSIYNSTGHIPSTGDCPPSDEGWASGGGTPNFLWSELNGGFKIDGNPHSPWGIVRTSLKNGLEATRANYNRGGIRLSSGFRCPHGNEVAGGVFNSYHVRGRAADMYSADHPWTEDEFMLLKDASLATTPSPVEGATFFWNTYTDHHYHAAW